MHVWLVLLGCLEVFQLLRHMLFQFKHVSDVTVVDLEHPGIPQCISIWPAAAAAAKVELRLYFSVYKGGKAPAVIERKKGAGLKPGTYFRVQ